MLLSRGRSDVPVFSWHMETGWPKVSQTPLFTQEAVTKNGKAVIKRKVLQNEVLLGRIADILVSLLMHH